VEHTRKERREPAWGEGPHPAIRNTCVFSESVRVPRIRTQGLRPVRNRSVDSWPFARAREWTNRLEYLSSETTSNSHDFPVHRIKFPVPDHRELDATAAETLGNLGPDSLREGSNRRNSLYFPCLTGICPQRRVRPGPRFEIDRQYSRNPLRCQRTTVSGWTMTRISFHPGQTCDRKTQKPRSAGVIGVGALSGRTWRAADEARVRRSPARFGFERRPEYSGGRSL